MDDPSGMADTFQEIFESTLDFHASSKKKLRAEFAPWLTSRLQKQMRLHNNVTKEIRKTIEDHYMVLVEKNKGDPRKMLKTINRVLEKNVKSTTLSCIENNGQTYAKECDMLEALNHHFVSVRLKARE